MNATKAFEIRVLLLTPKSPSAPELTERMRASVLVV